MSRICTNCRTRYARVEYAPIPGYRTERWCGQCAHGTMLRDAVTRAARVPQHAARYALARLLGR